MFLVLSAIATWIGKLKKEKMGTYEDARGWKNVLANGLIPVAVSFAYFLNHSYGALPGSFIAIAYVASVAAIAADKFASELGVLDGTPTMLLTLKKVKKGTSGGVTAFGLSMSLVAALIIAVSAFYITGSVMTVALVAASGFLGNIVDSIFGYYEEQGIGNKYTSNFLCSLAGVAACLIVLLY